MAGIQTVLLRPIVWIFQPYNWLPFKGQMLRLIVSTYCLSGTLKRNRLLLSCNFICSWLDRVVGFDGLKGLFQLKRYDDSMIQLRLWSERGTNRIPHADFWVWKRQRCKWERVTGLRVPGLLWRPGNPHSLEREGYSSRDRLKYLIFSGCSVTMGHRAR